MAQLDSSQGLLLDRRSHIRIPFKKTVRYTVDGLRPLRRLTKGISQNISLRGIQVLSPAVCLKDLPFDLWVPLDSHEILKARARTKWMEIETSFGDSPYWVRAGLSLEFYEEKDRLLLAKFIGGVAELPTEEQYEAHSKIGFVF